MSGTADPAERSTEQAGGFRHSHSILEHQQGGLGALAPHSLVLVVLRRLSFRRGLKSRVVLVIPQLVEVGLPVILRHQGLGVHASLGMGPPSAMMTACSKGWGHMRGTGHSPPRPSSPREPYRQPAPCCGCMRAACPHTHRPGTAPGGPRWPQGPCPSQHRTSGRGTSAHCCRPPTAR